MSDTKTKAEVSPLLVWRCLAAFTPVLGAFLLIVACTKVAHAQQQAADTTASQADRQGAALPEDPAVLAVLETNPSTPREWVHAAVLLNQLNQPELAKGFLQKVLNHLDQLDQQQRDALLVDLEREYGAATFLHLADEEQLQPQGRQLNEQVLSALERYLRDPGRLAEAVNQLSDASAEARIRALELIREARGYAVEPLLAALADQSRTSLHERVLRALVRLGSDAVEPMKAAFYAEDISFQLAAVKAAGYAWNSEYTHDLLAIAFGAKDGQVRQEAARVLEENLGSLPSPNEVAALLARYAEQFYQRQAQWLGDVDGKTRLWVWQAEAPHLIEKELPADQAARLLAVRYAEFASRVEPGNQQYQLLYEASCLDWWANLAGRDVPVDQQSNQAVELLSQLDVPHMLRLLKFTVDSEHAAAATMVVQYLSKISSEQFEQYRVYEQLSPLLRHGDRRLRFAAVQTILAHPVDHPFAGCSYILEALKYFCRARGERKILLVYPRLAEAHTIAGHLEQLGFKVDLVATGRAALELLLADPDYEAVFVHTAVADPPLERLLPQLRFDCRTKQLPVGILATLDQFKRAELLASCHERTFAFARPHTAQSVQWQVERLLEAWAGELVPADVRKAQSLTALQLLTQLAEHGCPYGTIRDVTDAVARRVVDADAVQFAAKFLAQIELPQAQKVLVDTASSIAYPIEIRKTAADAFKESVAKHGVLLTPLQVLEQYDRYNANIGADPETVEVLSFILDVIEGRKPSSKTG